MMKIVYILLLSGFVVSCAHEVTINPIVTVRKFSSHLTEIRIKKRHTGIGDLHSLSLKKYDFIHSDWIYVTSTNGIVYADDIIFTPHWACIEDPWKSKYLKGSIQFNENMLTIAIDLEQRLYKTDGSLSDYKPLDVNGTYKIEYGDKGKYRTKIEYSPCERK